YRQKDSGTMRGRGASKKPVLATFKLMAMALCAGRKGLKSRATALEADVNHQWIDPVIVGAPWALAGGLAAVALRTLRKHRPA
ncbi:MAG: hypothetical protein JWO34_1745, partial [Arthrobacter sp.]|nr:hypothetical protein [Arthrobacter sp.]